VRASKPDQAIYRAFEEDAGATGSEVAYFDDVAEYVEGARTMGWRAWQVPSGAEPAAFMRATLAEFGVR
jgi:HAD superfamily hydrolase (TIGR01509 family)